MIKDILLLLGLLIVGLVGIWCACKREDSYWDWLANYNLPKKKDDKRR